MNTEIFNAVFCGVLYASLVYVLADFVARLLWHLYHRIKLKNHLVSSNLEDTSNE